VIASIWPEPESLAVSPTSFGRVDLVLIWQTLECFSQGRVWETRVELANPLRPTVESAEGQQKMKIRLGRLARLVRSSMLISEFAAKIG